MYNFDNIYDWYKLPESENKRIFESGELVTEKNRIYVPVLWSEEVNYGKRYGLLSLINVNVSFKPSRKNPTQKLKSFFGVRVFSPDDWDMDLDFETPENSNGEEFKHLTEVTRKWAQTGPVDPCELFDLIKQDMLVKFENLKYYYYG